VLKHDEDQARKRLKRFKAEQRKKPHLETELKTLELRAEYDKDAHSSELNLDISAALDTYDDKEPTLDLLVKMYRRLKDRTPFWGLLNFVDNNLNKNQNKVNDDFELILSFETDMDSLLSRCEELIAYYYHNIPYTKQFSELKELSQSDQEEIIIITDSAYLEAFEITYFRNLSYVRQLEYQPLEADKFRERFKHALSLDEMDKIFMLDRVFHEIRCLPRPEQLIEALSEWDKNLKPSELTQKEHFITHNNDALNHLMREVRAKLRDNIVSMKAIPRRLRMEVFGLGDLYSGNLKDIYLAQMKLLPKVATPKELKLMLQSIDAIETQIHEAQKWMDPNKGQALKKLDEIRKSGIFNDSFIQILAQDLDQNAKELTQLLNKIAENGSEIANIKRVIDAGKDDDYLKVVIEHKDIEHLRRIYNFLENIAPPNLKRFALAYTRKFKILDAIIEGKAEFIGLDVPPTINSKIDRTIRKRYKHDKSLPHELRLAIYTQITLALEAECRLLAYTLNFVKFGEAKEKSAYKIPLLILETATHWGITDQRRRAARKYWIHLRDYLNQHEPPSFEKNYENNRKAFFTDKEILIGSKLDS
jgi:hypothetical protein